MKKKYYIPIVALFIALGIGCSKDKVDPGIPATLPDVGLATFSNPTTITNLYFGPGANQIYVYEGGEVGLPPEEEIRIEIRSETKSVMGITCAIQKDIVYKNGIVIEDTDDWIAQDDEGNLWYFGEFVINNKDNGDFKDNAGSWEAGINNAIPGYWLIGNPKIGDNYMQEYLKGEAEDYAIVVGFETVTIGLGTYDNCLVTKDINPSEKNVEELKYYAPGIGLIKEEGFEKWELVEIVELVEIIE
ncbi:MAG: hypothetical protein O2887_12870 [Bacteroidetes bacterium]|nr:hypothetical protein [Bacteroidota bacterium]MDA1121361.1 hypothetical protein [Bacteroidota bacterium]